MNEKTAKLIAKRMLEDTLTQEFKATLEDRIQRYLEVKPHPISPATYFAPVSAECSESYRDGHYYGCISLTQSVTEALVKHMCKANSWTPHPTNFKRNVEKTLLENKVIDKAQADNLLKIWEGRNDHHHLTSSVAVGKKALKELALEKLTLLIEFEKIVNGKLRTKNPKYWTIT